LLVSTSLLSELSELQREAIHQEVVTVPIELQQLTDQCVLLSRCTTGVVPYLFDELSRVEELAAAVNHLLPLFGLKTHNVTASSRFLHYCHTPTCLNTC